MDCEIKTVDIAHLITLNLRNLSINKHINIENIDLIETLINLEKLYISSYYLNYIDFKLLTNLKKLILPKDEEITLNIKHEQFKYIEMIQFI